MEGHISRHVTFFNTPNLLDHHPPYVPPIQVVGLAPGPAHEENGLDSQWSFGLEPKRKRPTEQVFLENNINISNSNNSQISSLDLFQARSVSTGLGLSLDNPRLTCSSSDSGLIELLGDALDQELQTQDAEMDRYMNLQGERLRQAILDKFHATQLQTISYIEDKISRKLLEKEFDIETINRKNAELELRLEQLALESSTWQQRAKQSEHTIDALKLNLHQLYATARSGDSKEGCGDSEIDDIASCFEGRPIESPGRAMTCKACGFNEVCMLVLPCKHLCLCKGCEGRLSLCPLCQSTKYIGMEVYM